MKFKVTKGDIANGKRCSIYRCPVALAIKRKLKIRAFPRSVHASPQWIQILGLYYRTPDSVNDFMQKFDGMPQCTLTPFEFDLPYECPEIKKS